MRRDSVQQNEENGKTILVSAIARHHSGCFADRLWRCAHGRDQHRIVAGDLAGDASSPESAQEGLVPAAYAGLGYLSNSLLKATHYHLKARLDAPRIVGRAHVIYPGSCEVGKHLGNTQPH